MAAVARARPVIAPPGTKYAGRTAAPKAAGLRAAPAAAPQTAQAMFIAPLVLGLVTGAALWTQHRANQASDALREEMFEAPRRRALERASAPNARLPVPEPPEPPPPVGTGSPHASPAPARPGGDLLPSPSPAPSSPAPTAAPAPLYGAPGVAASAPNPNTLSADDIYAYSRLLQVVGMQPNPSATDKALIGVLRAALSTDSISPKDRQFVRDNRGGSGGSAAASSGSASAGPPPAGYVRYSASFGGAAAYIANPHGHDIQKIALDQIIGLKLHKSNKMEGAPAYTPYVHPNDHELYIVTDDGAHTDGLKKITVGKSGTVRGGVHKFA